MSLNRKLLDWYKNNRRDLPWRKTSDPYKIWISEIILQQTRVDQGLHFYNRFINRFPTVFDLAKATMDEVMFYWKGLGYYSRARNLHFSANFIVSNLNGEFPANFNDLLQLKGVGKYTAGAIASIAYKEAVPVVDGNVVRVYSRLFGIDLPFDTGKGKRLMEDVAQKHLAKNAPGDYNQAIMDFGAVQCTFQKPDCDNCILKSQCYAFKNNMIAHLPVKSKRAKVKNRYFYFMVIQNEKNTYIEKREENDIWHSLYQFPLIETLKRTSFNKIIENETFKNIFWGNEISFGRQSREIVHILTHQKLHARFYHIKIKDKLSFNGYREIAYEELHTIPFPRLIEQYIENEF